MDGSPGNGNRCCHHSIAPCCPTISSLEAASAAPSAGAVQASLGRSPARDSSTLPSSAVHSSANQRAGLVRSPVTPPPRHGWARPSRCPRAAAEWLATSDERCAIHASPPLGRFPATSVLQDSRGLAPYAPWEVFCGSRRTAVVRAATAPAREKAVGPGRR